QLEEHFLTLGMGDIQAEAFFVAGPVGKRATFIPPLLPRHLVRERPGAAVIHMRGTFHPDDLSAKINQKRRAPGEHMHLLQGEHPDTLQDGIISHRHLLLDESYQEDTHGEHAYAVSYAGCRARPTDKCSAPRHRRPVGCTGCEFFDSILV